MSHGRLCLRFSVRDIRYACFKLENSGNGKIKTLINVFSAQEVSLFKIRRFVRNIRMIGANKSVRSTEVEPKKEKWGNKSKIRLKSKNFTFSKDEEYRTSQNGENEGDENVKRKKKKKNRRQSLRLDSCSYELRLSCTANTR